MNENSVKVAILKIKSLTGNGRNFNLYVGASVRLYVKSPTFFEKRKMPNKDLKIIQRSMNQGCAVLVSVRFSVAGLLSSGRRTANVVPSPGLLCKVILPPCALTI